MSLHRNAALRDPRIEEICPLCEQAIPPEKLVEIQQKERQRSEEQARALQAEFAKQREADEAAHAAQLKQLREQASAAIDKAKADQEELAAKAKAEGKAEAERAASAKVELERKKSTALKTQLDAAQEQNRLDRQKAEEQETKAKADGRAEAQKEARAQVEAATKATEAAEKRLADQKRSMSDTHQQELQKQREALEKAKETDLAKFRAEAFRERDQHLKTIEQLKRQLERKTANERGEGAEIDLYDALKQAFEDDQIKRIDKGAPGADIRHVVKHKGKVCGTILYDSKSHAQWRRSFVEKLREDQLAAGAEHAILATSVFPSGKQQLEIASGVVIANPARVVAIVSLIRDHLIRTHELRLSSKQRDGKKEALYDFMTSDRCAQIFAQCESLLGDVEDLDVSEQKAHQKVWQKRGKLIRNVQKLVASQLKSEIDKILGEEDLQ